MNEIVVSVVVAILSSGGVATLLNWMLNRKTDSKRVNYEGLDRQTDAFEQQRRAYDSIITKLNAQITTIEESRDKALAELEKHREGREDLLRNIEDLRTKVDTLQRDDRTRERKFVSLVKVFQDYVTRVTVPLTPDEWATVDDTIPPSLLTLKRRSNPA
jgi:septal ring factor EnvC (AmiA/AmiB activator)